MNRIAHLEGRSRLEYERYERQMIFDAIGEDDFAEILQSMAEAGTHMESGRGSYDAINHAGMRFVSN